MTSAIVLMAEAALKAELVQRVPDPQPVSLIVPAQIALTGLAAFGCFLLAKAGS